MKTFKKIFGIIVDVLIVLVFILSVCIIIMNLTYKKEDGYSKLFGLTFFTVESDSMEPTLKVGDMIIGKVVDEDTVINENDIISFWEYKEEVSAMVINTHRVVEIVGEGDAMSFITQGDNEKYGRDITNKTINDVISVYSVRLAGFGSVINFLKKPVGFVLCLVLPIVAVIGYQVYKLIALFMTSKKEEIIAEATEGTSDEVKDAIIKEYLARQAAANAGVVDTGAIADATVGADLGAVDTGAIAVDSGISNEVSDSVADNGANGDADNGSDNVSDEVVNSDADELTEQEKSSDDK